MKKFIKGKKGFSIMEVMIAMGIMTAGAASLMNMNSSMNKNLKNMESKMEEMMFLTQVTQSLNNPTTCTKTFGDYCENYEGDIINPTACKGTGMNWVENGLDLDTKFIPLKAALNEFKKVSNSQGLNNPKPSKASGSLNFSSSKSFSSYIVPRLFTFQNSASVDKLWLSRVRSFANTCKTMEPNSGNTVNTINRFKNLFTMGARFVFGTFVNNVNAKGPGGDTVAPELSNASASKTMKDSNPELKKNSNKKEVTALANLASILTFDPSTIQLAVQPTVPKFNIDIGTITSAIGSGPLVGQREENDKGEECDSNWSDNIVLKDIRISMDAGDPLPNLREQSVSFEPTLSKIIDLGLVTLSIPSPITCNNPYSELHGQVPSLSLHKVSRALTSDNKVIEFNKIRPKSLIVVVKYYLPNYLGGVHRSKTFTINAFPLMLDDQSDTSSVRVGKCGIFTDTYESTVYDGCSNIQLTPIIIPSLVYDISVNSDEIFKFDPSLGEKIYNTQIIRDILPPDIQQEIYTGIPTMPLLGKNITINPTVNNNAVNGAVNNAINSGAVNNAINSGAVNNAINSGAVNNAINSGAINNAINGMPPGGM